MCNLFPRSFFNKCWNLKFSCHPYMAEEAKEYAFVLGISFLAFLQKRETLLVPSPKPSPVTLCVISAHVLRHERYPHLFQLPWQLLLSCRYNPKIEAQVVYIGMNENVLDRVHLRTCDFGILTSRRSLEKMERSARVWHCICGITLERENNVCCAKGEESSSCM